MSRFKRFLRRLLIKLFILVLLFAAGLGAYVYFAPLPRIPDSQGSKMIDVNGELITVLARENRTVVKLEQIADKLEQATIAVEDSRFYNHHGLDLRGIARAFLVNLQEGRIVQGGSTITQQLAKNLFLSPEKTLTRKMKEMVYTLQLERHFSKQEILETYLNRIYFGHGAYGVEEAARVYFGKSAQELNLPEAAMLAGIPRGPSIYSPYLNFEAAKERQATVLNSMAEQGYISLLEAEQAKEAPLKLVGLKGGARVGSYFLQQLVRELGAILPGGEDRIYTGGLTITTTMDLKIQKIAEDLIKNDLPEGEKDKNGIRQPQGALVAIDPENGEVRALVGGRDFGETEFNRAVQAKRQPGSAFKPFLYAAALSGSYTLADRIMCEPKTYTTENGKTYTPKDAGTQGYHGKELTLREAIKESCNLVAVELNQRLGPELTAATAKKMGISSQIMPTLSLALGSSEVSPLELAAAFLPLANGGYRLKPRFYLEVKDKRGTVLLDQRARNKKEQVLNEEVAYLLTDALKEPLRPGGTAQSAGERLDRPGAGKTGTTQDGRDAWFVGYTPDLVAAVYIGYDHREKSVASGGRLAAPLWAEFINRALVGKVAADFARPPGITSVKLCRESGKLAGTLCPDTYEEIFIAGTVPYTRCDIHGFQNWWEELFRVTEEPEAKTEKWWEQQLKKIIKPLKPGRSAGKKEK